MRQETSGLYAVAVRPAGVGAGAVRHAYEIQRGVLLTRRWRFGGPRCAADEQEAQARNHRQDTRRHGAASAVELGRSLGAHAVRTRAEHTRTLGRPPLGWSPHRYDAEQALCRRADIFALRRNLRTQGNRRTRGCGKLPSVALRPIRGRGSVVAEEGHDDEMVGERGEPEDRAGVPRRRGGRRAALDTTRIVSPSIPRPGACNTTARERGGVNPHHRIAIRPVVTATRSRGARACRGRPHARCACPARLLARRLACSDSAKRRPPSPGGEPALAGGSIARGGAIFADSSSRGGRRT